MAISMSKLTIAIWLSCLLGLVALLYFTSPASADTLTEDFEDENLGGFDPNTEPSETWYSFRQGSDQNGEVVDTNGLDGTSQSFFINRSAGDSAQESFAQFNLENPTQVSSIEFWVEGQSPGVLSGGSQNFVKLESLGPKRSLVEFYIFCDNPDFPNACQFRVRDEVSNSTGAILIPYANNDTVFQVVVTPNWNDGTYCLSVDGADDGCHDFLHLPTNFGRFELGKNRTATNMAFFFDQVTILDGIDGQAEAVSGDAVSGIISFLDDWNFSSEASLFFFGLVILVIIVTAIAAGINAFTNQNIAFVSLLTPLFASMVFLAFSDIWPQWTQLVLIMLTSGIISLAISLLIISRGNSTGTIAVISGGLSYLIIIATILSLAGYAQTNVELPTSPAEDQNETQSETVDQSFGVTVLECAVSLFQDCSSKTETRVFKAIRDIATWAKAAGGFLFQLLTFQVPVIPTWANIIIITPPAASLAAVGVIFIRGGGG